MTKVVILGANGQIARVATDLFLKDTDAELTLYLRNARRLRASTAMLGSAWWRATSSTRRG